MIIYSIYLILFFLDICLTGFFQQKIFYCLYCGFAYQSVQKNLGFSTFFLFFLLALQSFFDTGIFGIWLIFIIPFWYIAQLLKTIMRNYSFLIAILFSCTYFATFCIYYFYFHYPINMFILCSHYIYNMIPLLISFIILQPTKETSRE